MTSEPRRTADLAAIALVRLHMAKNYDDRDRLLPKHLDMDARQLILSLVELGSAGVIGWAAFLAQPQTELLDDLTEWFITDDEEGNPS